MKRYVCTVATGLLLALVSTGTAAAIEPLPLPIPDQSGTQEATFGDQTAQQSNDADVSQKQGNGNVNVAPAIAIFGDAETTTVQGSGNEATANVDQSNAADQSQSSEQKQSLDQEGGSCCDGQSQTGEQTADFGDQTAQQSNTADVDQWQGNGNLNIAPAVSIFGDAETKTVQGSGNEATANVDQSNEASQSQDSTQKQWLEQDGGSCCKPPVRCVEPDPCSPKKEYGGYEKGTYGKEGPQDRCCEHGQSQTGEQTASFGDQTARQSNTADVTQKQGNLNGSFAPAIAFGKGKGKGNGDSCYSKCGKPAYGGHSFGGDAETKTVQGSGNTAIANVGQSNSADQSQTSYQRQNVVDLCKGLIHH
jgi:hypothetical protein